MRKMWEMGFDILNIFNIFNNFKVFLCIFFIVAVGFGQVLEFLGSEPIENSNDDNINAHVLIFTVENEDAGCTMGEYDIIDEIENLFSCLSFKDDGPGLHLIGLTFTWDEDNSCFRNNVNIREHVPCLHGVAYDVYGTVDQTSDDSITKEMCQSESTFYYAWQVDEMDGVMDSKFTTFDNPQSVPIYVFDTGIRWTHDDFEGRVVNLGSYEGFYYEASDDVGNSGHGTIVASLAAGARCGTGGNQTIYNVNVAEYSTSRLDLYISSEYVVYGLRDTYRHMRQTDKIGVINFSISFRLEGTLLELMEDMLANITGLGSILVAAAGNNYIQGCHETAWPGNSNHTISVGAYNKTRHPHKYSNFGPCVDVYAPGYGVYVADVILDFRYDLLDDNDGGTSFASPLVAGIVANYLAECDYYQYWEHCTKERVIERLKSRDESLIPWDDWKFGETYRCVDHECVKASYQCGQSFVNDTCVTCAIFGSYCLACSQELGCTACIPPATVFYDVRYDLQFCTTITSAPTPVTDEPSSAPSGAPSGTPTSSPSMQTLGPSASPTRDPSPEPTAVPSGAPSVTPTMVPTSLFRDYTITITLADRSWAGMYGENLWLRIEGVDGDVTDFFSYQVRGSNENVTWTVTQRNVGQAAKIILLNKHDRSLITTGVGVDDSYVWVGWIFIISKVYKSCRYAEIDLLNGGYQYLVEQDECPYAMYIPSYEPTPAPTKLPTGQTLNPTKFPTAQTRDYNMSLHLANRAYAGTYGKPVWFQILGRNANSSWFVSYDLRGRDVWHTWTINMEDVGRVYGLIVLNHDSHTCWPDEVGVNDLFVSFDPVRISYYFEPDEGGLGCSFIIANFDTQTIVDQSRTYQYADDVCPISGYEGVY